MPEKSDRQEWEEKERRSLYWAGWILFGIGVLYALLNQAFDISARGLPCLFHTITGAYCPGCGGSRAVAQLFQGNIIKSLYYHPLVLYGAVFYLWFMISNSMEYLSKGKIRIGLRWRRGYVIAGVILLILNWIWKNAALFIWDVPML